MNENLMNRIKKAGVSQYRLSHETGIPYTTISRLERGTMDVNRCSVEVVHRLSLYFGCSIEDILNSEAYLTGITGSYRGYKYHWEESGQDILVIEKGKEKTVREFGGPQTDRKYYKSSKVFAEMEIDLCIRKKEAEKVCDITG